MRQSTPIPSVLIFGASRGIGSALADQLAQIGYGLTLAARNRGRQDVLATVLNANSSSVDVTNSAEVEASVAGGFEMHSRLNGVVNCVSAALHPIGRIGEADEVANAIRWFFDPQQSWVTGQLLVVVDGLGSVQTRIVANT